MPWIVRTEKFNQMFQLLIYITAHGGNRTGRIFTGDSSGDWLVRALFETGFANKPTSVSKDDELILNDAYLTTSSKDVPRH